MDAERTDGWSGWRKWIANYRAWIDPRWDGGLRDGKTQEMDCPSREWMEHFLMWEAFGWSIKRVGLTGNIKLSMLVSHIRRVLEQNPKNTQWEIQWDTRCKTFDGKHTKKDTLLCTLDTCIQVYIKCTTQYRCLINAASGHTHAACIRTHTDSQTHTHTHTTWTQKKYIGPNAFVSTVIGLTRLRLLITFIWLSERG